ncbi:glycoside hydrolase family 19 protein [Arabidopsis lyrata subsp. lyrata]|uniref:Glycoside hydrolase family 19 protein n=1 Tax=Arabidopsis lyrata subsp. lyrata TaxID=81972 RepID=D7LKG2_ARALL|nr:glycoside hydrolase family 19 protein [Arabidopsis lyrata subsp. lyrata]
MTSQNAILKNALVVFLFNLAILAETVFSQNCMDTNGVSVAPKMITADSFVSVALAISRENPTDMTTTLMPPRGKIETVITPALFDSIMSKVESNCSAKGFYTYEAFITAFKSFGAYKGKVAKREIAAILAHFSYGSKSFCDKEEISNERYCSKSKKYPCEPGKNYFGRGLLQSITWNEYYGAAGKHLGLPLLKDPDLVARSPEVAFKFAMWFWNRNVRPALYLGFGEITKRVDGRECGNWRRDDTKNKVKQYIEFCEMLGVTPDQGLDC